MQSCCPDAVSQLLLLFALAIAIVLARDLCQGDFFLISISFCQEELFLNRRLKSAIGVPIFSCLKIPV
jgi:hypothetical protein